jgi:CRISPR-associated endonuclease Cas2
MARPKKVVFNLREKLEKIHAAGIKPASTIVSKNELPDLNARIKSILQIVQAEPIKATEMTYLIMYDITDDKVRTQIAKYLIKQGCVRIQMSVYLVKSKNNKFTEIHSTLKEVNEFYENADSIILVPINASDVRSMKLIGKNVDISTIVDKPNTLFF